MKKRYFVDKSALDRVTLTGKLTSSFLNALLTQPHLTQRLWLLLALLGAFLSATAQFCPNGTIVAGGNGQGNAPNQISGPYDVVLDGAGNIYISERNNNRVQKFAPGSTQGVTVAGGNGQGSGLNQFNQPQGLVLDAAGYLYVTDYNNHRVLKFAPNSTSATDGIVVAGGNGSGNGLNQLENPTTIAMDASSNLYVLDNGNNRVLKFPPNSTSATSGTIVAGGNGSGPGLNQFGSSDGVFVDAAGAIYVSDSSNQRVLKFPPNSTQSTSGTIVAGGNGFGSGLNQLFNQRDVWVNGAGYLYVSDRANTRVLRFAPGSNQTSSGVVVAGGNGNGSGLNQFDRLSGLFVDVAGNLYVADQGNDRVLRFTPGAAAAITQQPSSGSSVCAGATVTTSVSASGTVSSYQWYKDGNLLASQTSATLSLPNTQTANSSSYVVVVTGSCTSVTSTAFSLTVNPLPTQFNVTGGGAYCTGGSGVAVGLSGSQTGVNYQLLRGGSSVTTVAGTGNPISFGTQTAASTYTVQATSTAGSCQQTMSGSVNVSINNPPTATLVSSGSLTCANRTVTLTAGGGTSYVFGSGATPTGPTTATVANEGLYSVTVTDANGCTALQTTTVQSNTTAPTATLNNSGPITCTNRTVTLTAGGGGSYVFSSGASQQNGGNTATVTNEGTYTVTVTNPANGCSSFTTTQVQSNTVIPQNVTLSSSGTLTCTQMSVNLTAGTSTQGVSYNFTGPGVTNQNGAMATATQEGMYTVKVTGTNGCTATQTTQVQSSTTAPNASLTNNGPLTSTNPTVTLIAGGGDTYAFSSGASQQGGDNTATVTNTGTYQVTVTTSSNGCSATASTTVTGAVSQSSCRNGTAVITVMATGTPVKYEWYRNSISSARLTENPAQVRGTSTASLTLVNQQVTADYYVRVTDANGSAVVYGPFRMTVNLNCNVYARIGAEEVELRISLLGNPLEGEQLRATITGAAGKTLTVHLLDLSGKPIRAQQWQQADVEQSVEWNLSGQASGVYLLQANTEASANGAAQRQSLKVVKK